MFVCFLAGFFRNNCPGGGVFSTIFLPQGSGFRTFFVPGGEKFALSKFPGGLPGGMVSLGID